jgi:hypothetical protein
MIHIQEQPEPGDFSRKVREPGSAFLQKVPHPTGSAWNHREYWQYSLSDLYDAYNGVCAYSAHWIPCSTGVATVDHFIPKSVEPQLAYEWRNYRLASLKLNSRKGEYQDVLDPFKLQPDWFILDFPSLLVKPNSSLSASEKEQVHATIKRLKLNDDDTCVQDRLHWIRDFAKGELSFSFLKRKAPFLAYELQRQGLVDNIAVIMKVSQ